MARLRYKRIASVLLVCCTFAFVIGWFLFGQSEERPKVTVSLIGYSNSAEGLVAIVGVTNRGRSSVVSDGAPEWDLEATTTSGVTNTHPGHLTITEWPRVLNTGQGAALKLHLPPDTLQWKVEVFLEAASVRDRVVNSTDLLFLKYAAWKVLPSRRGSVGNVMSPAYSLEITNR